MIRTIHRAKYVLAESDLLLADAAVHVSDPGRISRVEPWTGPPRALEAEVLDWGSAVIIPGLVNAHAHLELTGLAGQLANLGSFSSWIRGLVAARSALGLDDVRAALGSGARQALAGGTTLLADVSSLGVSQEVLELETLGKVVFEEVIGFRPELAPQALASLETRLTRVEPDPLLELGVSPHAPYSVSPELFRAAASLAALHDLPVAVHTAETRSELEFLAAGSGELREMLEEFGALPPDWRCPGLAPIAYLEQLGLLERPMLIVHGNYLDEESIGRILRSRSTVVYCPRSHAFFGHDPHPVRRLLDAGVNVALGTDSLASNESLSLLDEVRFLFERRKDLRPEEIVRMATVNGAAALGFAGLLGRLRRGTWADMAVVELPESISPRRLLAQVLEGAGTCIATVVRGRMAWRREPA
jgi:cytosine/adenosine deaminase-related metal-dependent hydrolase